MYGCVSIELVKVCPKCGKEIVIKNPMLFKEYVCSYCGVMLELVWNEDKEIAELKEIDQ